MAHKNSSDLLQGITTKLSHYFERESYRDKYTNRDNKNFSNTTREVLVHGLLESCVSSEGMEFILSTLSLIMAETKILLLDQGIAVTNTDKNLEESYSRISDELSKLSKLTEELGI